LQHAVQEDNSIVDQQVEYQLKTIERGIALSKAFWRIKSPQTYNAPLFCINRIPALRKHEIIDISLAMAKPAIAYLIRNKEQFAYSTLALHATLSALVRTTQCIGYNIAYEVTQPTLITYWQLAVSQLTNPSSNVGQGACLLTTAFSDFLLQYAINLGVTQLTTFI
jgi:hypothetical protein